MLALAAVTLSSLARVTSFAGAGSANAWLRSSGEITLLPFPMADGLLPGESLSIHLSAPSSMALLATAMQSHNGCVAQLIQRTESSVCAAAPLLEVREHRRHPCGHGLWCSMTCVGAVRVSGIELRDAEGALCGVPASSTSQFLAARAVPLCELESSVDFESADDEEAYLAGEVEAAFESVNALRRKALALSDRDAPGSDRHGRPPPADDFVEDGYRLSPLVGPYVDMDGLQRLRTEALCARGPDEAPHADLSRFQELWGTADGESTRRRLLSFTACCNLDDECRMGALAFPDTVARLEFALHGLRHRRSQLAAEIALRKATQ